MRKRFKEVGLVTSVLAVLWILIKIISFLLKWVSKANVLKNISDWL